MPDLPSPESYRSISIMYSDAYTLNTVSANQIENHFAKGCARSFFEIGMKTTFSSPVATAEFSKFAVILSAALSQHHLSGFGIAQLEFYHLH